MKSLIFTLLSSHSNFQEYLMNTLFKAKGKKGGLGKWLKLKVLTWAKEIQMLKTVTKRQENNSKILAK